MPSVGLLPSRPSSYYTKNLLYSISLFIFPFSGSQSNAVCERTGRSVNIFISLYAEACLNTVKLLQFELEGKQKVFELQKYNCFAYLSLKFVSGFSFSKKTFILISVTEIKLRTLSWWIIDFNRCKQIVLLQ